MADKPNFVMVYEPETEAPPPKPPTLLDHIRGFLTGSAPQLPASVPTRPRLIFGFDATASREPAWATARTVTDALVKALPGELDVALAVHGGGRVHTFTAFTSDANTLRDRAAGITCESGLTRLLPILAASLKQPAVQVVVYIGDVFEESLPQGRRLADSMGAQRIKLIVLHDTADHAARRDAEMFWDLAKRTGGCVLPFDANASDRLRDLLSAVAVYAVGGEKLLRERRHALPGAVALLEHLGKRG